MDLRRLEDKISKFYDKEVIEDDFFKNNEFSNSTEEFRVEDLEKLRKSNKMSKRRSNSFNLVKQFNAEDFELENVKNSKILLDSRFEIRISKYEREILNFLKDEGINIADMLRSFILQQGKKYLLENEFLEKYQADVKEYGRLMQELEKCQNYYDKIKYIRGLNLFSANILTNLRKYVIYKKIRPLKREIRNLNANLEKIEKIIN